MAAFRRAAGYAIDGFEFDVQLSRDDVPFIFHDRTLKKINGESTPASELTIAELSRLDWGGWYDDRFAGEPLTTFADVLNAYGATHRLLIELKSYNRTDAGHNDRLASIAVDTVKSSIERSVWRSVYFLSFDQGLLDRIIGLEPEFACILNLPTPLIGKIKPHPVPDYLRGLGVEIKALGPAFGEFVKKNGMELMTYSCDTAAQVTQAAACGADIVLTDDPGWITRYLEKCSPCQKTFN